MTLNIDKLKIPKLPVVISRLNSVIDNNILWTPSEKEVSTVAITPVNTENSVSTRFDPEERDMVPRSGGVSEPALSEIPEKPSEATEVADNSDIEEESSTGFKIKEL